WSAILETEIRDDAAHPMARRLKIVNFVAALLFTPHKIYVKIEIHRQPPCTLSLLIVNSILSYKTEVVFSFVN
ncbi:MAG: hypothetical protein MR430_07625, partial [Lachnospiraceae bacterium]|nr:hypothetical protein [Lachnospiraceae bacterium]